MPAPVRLGVDLTACWRPRVGMSTVSLELTRAMLAESAGADGYTLFCSRGRPAGVGPDGGAAVLSPHRHEIANKLFWLPSVEAAAGLDAILYPYWPSPPRRRRGAPPAIVFVHDLAYRIRPDEVPWQQRLYLGNLMPPALRQAAAVLVPSEATRRDLLDCYPLPGLEERVHVVPEGGGLDRVRATAEGVRATAGGDEASSLPAGLEPGYVLAVGTIEPRKNYPTLLAAHRMLRARRPVPPLVVAGRVGWAYGDAVRDLREDPEVRVLGHVDDATLLALYRNAAALAFPSLYEGFGLPLLEAMREGIPALIGDTGSLPELAAGCALAVPAADVEAVADGLERLLTDTVLRTDLAERGRRRSRDFTWAEAARRTLGVVHSVA